VTLFVNDFGLFRVAQPAHNGLVAGSSRDILPFLSDQVVNAETAAILRRRSVNALFWWYRRQFIGERPQMDRTVVEPHAAILVEP
jgi:hypothetical protein